ncbi:hypothetical protein Zmor_016981 [Zophobas morio]|uniref:Uncharacterized protein n=1 Tax=Zophobas morio TaxID=2755281 RepID=A0AA38IAI3_9CUCU|nr:hypothetical protein Zmor_016981 [Zophobas morio]
MKLLIFLIAVTTTQCSVPPNFKRCLRKDPEFKKCYIKAAQFGITQLTKPYKAFDLPNLEPLLVPSLTIAGRGGVVDVDQTFKNCKVHGLTTMKLDKFELNFTNKTLDIVAGIKKLAFECEYKLDGKVLLLTIQGEGDSLITFSDFRAVFNASFEEVTKGAKTYYKTGRTELVSRTGNMHFQFDNLFNGNKELGDNINSVLNDNWKQIFDELYPDYNEVVRRILTDIMTKIWDNVSLEEFFD